MEEAVRPGEEPLDKVAVVGGLLTAPGAEVEENWVDGMGPEATLRLGVEEVMGTAVQTDLSATPLLPSAAVARLLDCRELPRTPNTTLLLVLLLVLLLLVK